MTELVDARSTYNVSDPKQKCRNPLLPRKPTFGGAAAHFRWRNNSHETRSVLRRRNTRCISFHQSICSFVPSGTNCEENLTKRWVLLPPAEPNQCQYRGELSFLSEIHAAGVDLFLHRQGIHTTTPGGKAMFQMLGVFAEFERSVIQERVRAGLRRAKAEGKQLGRPR
jgi:hypothetical protein